MLFSKDSIFVSWIIKEATEALVSTANSDDGPICMAKNRRTLQWTQHWASYNLWSSQTRDFTESQKYRTFPTFISGNLNQGFQLGVL